MDHKMRTSLVCVLFAVIFINDAGSVFYLKDVKNLEEAKKTFTGGVRAFAASMELSILSHYSQEEEQLAKAVSMTTVYALAHIARSEMVYFPGSEKIAEQLSHHEYGECLIQTHTKLMEEAGKTLKEIESKRKRHEDTSDLATVNKLWAKNRIGAIKLLYKTPPTFLSPHSKWHYGRVLTRNMQRLAPKGKIIKEVWQYTNPYNFFKSEGKLAQKIMPKIFNINKAFHVKGGVPIADLVTLGLSAKTLYEGLTSNPKDEQKVLLGSLGIAGSCLGIIFFLAAAAFALPVIGQIGFLIGLMFTIITTIFSMGETTFNRQYKVMEQLWITSMYEGLGPYQYLQDMGMVGFNDVYAVNQAALMNWRFIPNRDEPLTLKEEPNQFSYKDRLNAQKSEMDKFLDTDEVEELMEKVDEKYDGKEKPDFLPMGKHRKGGDKELGFDFFGFVNKSQEFKGVTVLVYTSPGVRKRREVASNFNGILIDTTDFDEDNSNHISIRDYYLEPTKKILIRTGSADDSLNIDGVIQVASQTSQPEEGWREDYPDWTTDPPIEADLGLGRNVLNLGAQSSGNHRGWTGMAFNVETGFTQYIGSWVHEHKYQKKYWPLGTIKGAKILVGSYRDDVIVLGDDGSGVDDYDLLDPIELNSRTEMEHFTVLQLAGDNLFILDMDRIHNRKAFTIVHVQLGESGVRVSPKYKSSFPKILLVYKHKQLTKKDLVHKNMTLLVHYGLRQMVRIYLKANNAEVATVERHSDDNGESVDWTKYQSKEYKWTSVRELPPVLVDAGEIIQPFEAASVEVAHRKSAMSSAYPDASGNLRYSADMNMEYIQPVRVDPANRDSVGWWQVDLGAFYGIVKVVVQQRMKFTEENVLKGAKVYVIAPEQKKLIGTFEGSDLEDNEFPCEEQVRGESVRLEHNRYMRLGYVMVFHSPYFKDYGSTEDYQQPSRFKEGTKHIDIFTLSCPMFLNEYKKMLHLEIDMKDGADHIILSRAFLNECVDDLVGNSEYDDQLKIKKVGHKSVRIWIAVHPDKVEKKTMLTVKNVEKVLNEYGEELLDVKYQEPNLWDENDEIDLGLLYSVVTGKAFGILETDENFSKLSKEDVKKMEAEELAEINSAKLACNIK